MHLPCTQAWVWPKVWLEHAGGGADSDQAARGNARADVEGVGLKDSKDRLLQRANLSAYHPCC